MGLENLIGRECMLQAVSSAIKLPPSDEALVIRSRQLEESQGLLLDPNIEAQNLQELLEIFGQKLNVQIVTVTSISELSALVDENNHVFVGFRGGSDGNAPHIAHVAKRVDRGFWSNQQFTPDYILSWQIIEQHQLDVFLVTHGE